MLTRRESPGILRTMRLLTGALVLAVLLTGCANVALPTDPEWVAGRGCRGVGVDGILRGSKADPRVAWMADNLSGERVELIWPVGYHARFSVYLEVLDDRAVVVGRAGDRIIGTCFRREPGDPLHVSAEELRPPDWQPGDG